jgi:hypothetical protein
MEYKEEQYWLCHKIVEEAHDAIIMADREGMTCPHYLYQILS